MNKRELPVLWKITKGSFINKIIIFPVAFLLSAFVPVVVSIILLFGGIYLAYEGAHKVYQTFFHSNRKQDQKLHKKLNENEYKIYEDKKVKSALLVDFILSIEIIIIALSTVTEAEIIVQIFVVSLISIMATVGVCGVVALIIRMDDVGYRMIKSNISSFSTKIGNLLVKGLPWVVKTLSFVGTIALFLVSGGIFRHNVNFIHDLVYKIPPYAVRAAPPLLISSISLTLSISAFQSSNGFSKFLYGSITSLSSIFNQIWSNGKFLVDILISEILQLYFFLIKGDVLKIAGKTSLIELLPLVLGL